MLLKRGEAMPLILKTPPTSEVLTLTQIKKRLRISSYSPSDDITPVSTIAPGSHPIGSITGTVVDVSGYNAYFIVDSRTNGESGTVDLSIKESNDNTTFNVWTGGSFAQITTANDNQFYKLDYTGNKRYLRVDSVTAGAACEFGVNIIKDSPVCSEDDTLTEIRKTVRETAEEHMNMAFLPQTWQLVLDDWPAKDYIDLGISPVRSITSITYIDSDEVSHTFSTDYYYLDENQKPPRAVLKYAEVWPTETLRPSGAITVEFEAGFTDLSTYQAKMNSTIDDWMLAACYWKYHNPDKELSPDNFKFRALNFSKYNTRKPFA
jgi:uncharacterized phiE125 gp8 family phage protein